MSRVVEFIDRTSPKPSQQVCEVALLVSLLKTRSVISFLGSTNGIEDLVPDLECELHMQLPRLTNHMRKSIDHAVIAGAISVAWHATACRQGNKTRAHSLFEFVSAIAASKYIGAKIAKAAAEIMTQSEAEITESTERDRVLFSISIDLAGSTQAKTEALAVSPNNQQRIDEINLEIMRHFQRTEQEFYRRACSRYTEGGGLEPRLFFSVKGIGDEIWILAEADRLTAIEAGRSLIDAELQISTQIIKHIAVENADGPNWHPDFDYGRTQPLALGIKVFIDVVQNATEIGSFRDDALHRFVPEILKERLGRDPNEREVSEVLNRLLLGGFEPAGWLGFYRRRSDFIGHEIDRFFRASKAALPGMVAIGQSMANLLHLQFRNVAMSSSDQNFTKSLLIRRPILCFKKSTRAKLWQALSPLFNVPKIGRIFKTILDTVIDADLSDLLQAFLIDGQPLMGGSPRDRVYAVTRMLKAKELKGIGKDYISFLLFAPRSLKGMLVQEEADKKNGFRTFPLDGVRSLLSDDALQLLVDTEIQRKRL